MDFVDAKIALAENMYCIYVAIIFTEHETETYGAVYGV